MSLPLVLAGAWPRWTVRSAVEIVVVYPCTMYLGRGMYLLEGVGVILLMYLCTLSDGDIVRVWL